jgi:ABC-2 type transport system ATP-binding protein
VSLPPYYRAFVFNASVRFHYCTIKLLKVFRIISKYPLDILQIRYIFYFEISQNRPFEIVIMWYNSYYYLGGYKMLKIMGLTKFYGEKRAVDKLTLHIAPGEIYGFIGHNGAGKTTTIKCCCGILRFEEGEVFVDGISVKENPLECKKRLAYIPDNPDMYEFLSGIAYLNFVADVFGVPAKEREERIKKYADLFELTSDLAQPISAYSHGMKQKLALISAFLHEPKLIVMDEPFVGLDPKASHTLKGLMREHCAKGGAIFFSTHVLEVAEKLCDKVAIIKEGKLIVSGTMEDVKGASSLEDVFLELEGDGNV